MHKESIGRRLLALALFAMPLVPIETAEAGCWVCKDDRCTTATATESGKDDCLDSQICVVTCKDDCDTGGPICEGNDEVPGGPETQGLIVPNGLPLELLPLVGGFESDPTVS